MSKKMHALLVAKDSSPTRKGREITPEIFIFNVKIQCY